jgi:uncharacterized damage-inducible protein DinB
MSHIINGLLHAWNKNADYGQRLVADLDDAQMIAQPQWISGPPMNHPAWVLSHLNVYLPIIAAVIRDEAFVDPKDHEFGMHSRPQMDRATYASREELVGSFAAGHTTVSQLLESADDSVFAQAIRLPRWQGVFANAGALLPYLMLNHENGHLGQISAWRRALGLPPV